MNAITKSASSVGNYFIKNKIGIYTATAMVGVGITAYETYKATLKCKRIIEEEKPEGFKETAKLIWPIVISPIVSAGLTEMCIFSVYRKSKLEIAALQVVAKVASDKYDAYKEEASKYLTKTQKEKTEAATGAAIANQSGQPSRVTNTGMGDMLCFDVVSQHYFNSSLDAIKSVILEANERLFDGDLTLNDVYTDLRLPGGKVYEYIVFSKMLDPKIRIEPTIRYAEDPNYRTQCLYLDLIPNPSDIKILR